MVVDCSDLCPRKSHRVRTNTVEKANAGTLDWYIGNWEFPLYVKWQLPESMLHFHIYQWKIHSSRPSEVPQAWRHVFCIPLCLNGKVYFISPMFNRRPCDVTYLLSTLSEHQPKKGCQLVVAEFPTDFWLPLKETNSMSLACRESKVIRATIITTLAQTKHRGMYFG